MAGRDERGAPQGALPRLSRRGFLLGAGATVAGLGGVAASPVRAGGRFPGADEFEAEAAAAWFDLSLELVQHTPGYSPPVASRAFAYAGISLYEALLPGLDGYRSLSGLLPGLEPLPAAGANGAYDWPTVAGAALAAILRGLFPTAPAAQQAELASREASLEVRTRASLPRGIADRSLARGRAVADAVYEWSRADGGHEGYLSSFPPYTPPSGPGLWEPTPPGFLPALQPFWGSNRSLCLPDGAACPPGEHPPFSRDPASDFYAEALEAYEAVNGLTAEQEEIARFWADDPGTTPTPPGHSIAITSQVLRREQASLATAAEAYLRVGVAVCDAFIACWHQKYVDNLLRPVTYLQQELDPDWLPLLITPPFPEYPSGHSVQSGAAFHVLTDLFGDCYAFTDHSHDRRGLAPRSFPSFLAAAEEAAVSRLYGGIHFRAAIDDGLAQGSCIGQAVSALPLRG